MTEKQDLLVLQLVLFTSRNEKWLKKITWCEILRSSLSKVLQRNSNQCHPHRDDDKQNVLLFYSLLCTWASRVDPINSVYYPSTASTRWACDPRRNLLLNIWTRTASHMKQNCIRIQPNVSYTGKLLTVLRVSFDVITSIVSFLWEYTTAARDVTF